MVKAASADPLPTRPRRRMWEVVQALGRPKVALMLALGFSSGLPFMLIGNTLGLWLAADGIRLAVIGFLSWAGLPYLAKFIWGAVVDRVKPPLPGKLGRRRGWMVASQIVVAGGLMAMAAVNPSTAVPMLALFAVITGVAAATQDTVIDAWRIESAEDADELGLLTAAYTLGFRVALIATEAWILLLARVTGWPTAYALFGGLMIVGIAAALLAKEPARADAVMDRRSTGESRQPLRALHDSLINPFVIFFRTHGWGMAMLMLGTITLYHLSDYMRGPMSNPYYKALGIDLGMIGWVRTSIGLVGSVVGIALGGLSCLRIGNRPTLVLGAIIQPIGIGAFALLGWRGGDFSLTALGPLHLTAFQAIMGFDAFAIGFSGVALVSYMSTLTSLGYTATQYALLTSALAWTGKILKGFSGVIVEALHNGRSLLDAYALFYLLSAAIGLPAIVLCIVLALRQPSPSFQEAPA